MDFKKETAERIISDLRGDNLSDKDIIEVLDEATCMMVSNLHCCNNCKHFGYEPSALDQPYPEFWCSKKHWDGVEDPDDLHEPIECVDFEHKYINKEE